MQIAQLCFETTFILPQPSPTATVTLTHNASCVKVTSPNVVHLLLQYCWVMSRLRPRLGYTHTHSRGSFDIATHKILPFIYLGGPAWYHDYLNE